MVKMDLSRINHVKQSDFPLLQGNKSQGGVIGDVQYFMTYKMLKMLLKKSRGNLILVKIL